MQECEIVRQYRERMLKDPYRPRYHFAIPDGDGRPGDPNGCFFDGGRHHLMYLYRRDGKAFHWGHVSSVDLLNWRHHEDSLLAGERDEGCFSGGAFVDDNGTAYISYWIFNERQEAAGRDAGIGISKSLPPYEHWERLPAVCIPSTEWGIRDEASPSGEMEHLGCADPSNIWKKDGVYYMQTGNLLVLNKYGRSPGSPAQYRGDWVELFSSHDLQNWKHEGRFYDRRVDNTWTDETEDDMCPSFLPLPTSPDGGASSGKYLQLFIAHNKGCQYYIGDYRGDRFYPEAHGRMSWVDNSYFAPEAYVDGNGRQIMFAWLLDNLPDDYGKFGWSGVFSLPRTLWLDEDGELGIAPVEELKALRLNRIEVTPFDLNGDAELPVPNGTACELALSIDPQSTNIVGIKVLCSADGARVTYIYYDAADGALVMDATHSGSPVRAVVERAPFRLKPGEALSLRVFVDRSVVEVFANDRQAIGRRVYGQPGDAYVFVFSDGQARVLSACAWEMAPSQPY